MKLSLLWFMLPFYLLATVEEAPVGLKVDQDVIATSPPRLVKLWETDPVFSFPESAVYDPTRDLLYISNIGPTDSNNLESGDGFISKMNLKGEVIELKWITGLNNPKGMDLQEDTLWVNDMHDIVEVDLNTGVVRERTAMKQPVFLNDIGVGPDGAIYSNDADGHKVYMKTDGGWEIVWSDETKGRPNGIFVEEGRLLLAQNWSNELISLDRETLKKTVLAKNIGAADGIEPDGVGGYFLTDYKGRVFYYDQRGDIHTLLDSRGQKLTADLAWIAQPEQVILPSHKNDTVAAWRVERP